MLFFVYSYILTNLRLFFFAFSFLLLLKISQGWSLSGSPQSTLCSALGGCDCNQGSSRGSPNGPSRVASPPDASRTDGAWDLLYAAAGEVARMRMAETGAGFHSKNNGPYAPRKPAPISVPRKTPSPNPAFQPSQPHPPYQHLKALQVR